MQYVQSTVLNSQPECYSLHFKWIKLRFVWSLPYNVKVELCSSTFSFFFQINKKKHLKIVQLAHVNYMNFTNIM